MALRRPTYDEMAKRVRAATFWVAGAVLLLSWYVTARFVRWVGMDAVNVETLAAVAWIPMYWIAWLAKTTLDDYLLRGVPDDE